ncbi:MAG: hypothetical protein RIQ60_1463 [Pseudomonadota bacterium]|jgi:hypothetical protein
MTAPTFVNDSLAKGLSKQSIEYLVMAARMCSDAIDDNILDAIRAQRAGKSPAKLANQLQAGIARLIARPGIHGRLVPGTARSFGYFYVTPEVKNDHLVFSVAIGLVNTRARLGQPSIYPVVEITRHSVERLHQRLNTTEFGQVYFEIVTITLMALDMHQAAKQTGSRQWALPSRRGIFVAVPGETAPLSTLVTWISYDHLSSKWSRLVADLREIPQLGEFGTNHKPRLVDILSRHSWLQERYEAHPEPSAGPGKS